MTLTNLIRRMRIGRGVRRNVMWRPAALSARVVDQRMFRRSDINEGP